MSRSDSWESQGIPNPGSEEAKSKGCTCPVLDNHHGHGYCGLASEGIFVIVEGCPLHDPNYEVGSGSKNDEEGFRKDKRNANRAGEKI